MLTVPQTSVCQYGATAAASTLFTRLTRSDGSAFLHLQTTVSLMSHICVLNEDFTRTSTMNVDTNITVHDIISKVPFGGGQKNAALIPYGQTLTKENILDDKTKLWTFRSQSVVIVDRRVVPYAVISPELLASRLPHIHGEAREALLVHLKRYPREQINIDSIEEHISGVDQHSAIRRALYEQILILSHNPACPQMCIDYQGEELFPCELLADGAGVRFHSNYTYEYKAVEDEDRDVLTANLAEEQRVEKLIHQLKIALKDNKAAIKEHSEADDMDLNCLGAMVIEQKRITQEITTQCCNLEMLQQEITSARDSPSMITFFFRTAVVLPFGASKLGDRVYHIQRISRPDVSDIMTAANVKPVSEEFYPRALGLDESV